jgi:uncharacterized RDD family membrane protein YckC
MSDLTYAKFPQRLGAFLIDAVICLIFIFAFAFIVDRPIIMAVMIPAGAPPGHIDPAALWEAAEPGQKAIVLLLFVLSAWVPSTLYYAAMESSSRRATLGKMALNLVVMRTDGSRVSFLRAAGRHFFRVFISCVMPFAFLGMLPIFGSLRQGAHDWISGIVVVRN